jgi:hypothetical protein
MSLVRLLSMSQSVDGKADQPSRYKMAPPLPKFAPVKRPISLAPTKPENAESTKVMDTPSLFTEAAATQSTAPAPLSQAPEPPVGVLSIGVFQPASAAVETAAPEKKQGPLARFFNVFRRKPQPIRLEGPVVQAEWSMDKVKVVRNDLSDADLDLVFASIEQPKKAEPVKKEQLVSSAWRRVNPNPDKTEQMVLK